MENNDENGYCSMLPTGVIDNELEGIIDGDEEHKLTKHISHTLDKILEAQRSITKTNRFFRYENSVFNVNNIVAINTIDRSDAMGSTKYGIHIEFITNNSTILYFNTKEKRDSEFDDLWQFLYKEDLDAVILEKE